MSERIITISESLWLIQESDIPELDDGLLVLRDCTRGNVLIDRAELPALIAALQSFVVAPTTAESTVQE